jgi:hypothetical protein
MNVIRRLAHRSVHQLVRAACWLALFALAAFALAIVWPVALPVIFGMSFGHGIGAVAFLLYLVSVVITMSRKEPGYEPYKPRMSKPTHEAPKRNSKEN